MRGGGRGGDAGQPRDRRAAGGGQAGRRQGGAGRATTGSWPASSGAGCSPSCGKAHGAAEITEVTRQKVDWQRQAARDLAEGRFDSAVQAFDRHGAITWTADGDSGAGGAGGRGGRRTRLADPRASRFVFAYTNADVSQLNAELRQVRRDRGELASPDVRLETKHGEADFAVGDRVQFTDTDKKRQHLQRQRRGHHRHRRAHGAGHGAAGRARPGAAGREVTWSTRPSSRASGTATRGRSTRARARRWTTRICCTRTTGGRRRATWR